MRAESAAIIRRTGRKPLSVPEIISILSQTTERIRTVNAKSPTAHSLRL